MSLIVDIEKKLGDFNLSVKFESHEQKVALFGLSGSGKTVTLKCIAGILTPDKGRIVIDGVTVFDKEKKINLAPQKRNVGYLPQHYALFPNMTIEQNIMTGIRNKKERKSICDKYISDFLLDDIRLLYPHEISGGQAQRVALARALASAPSVLLLDEPFSALDSQLRSQLEYSLVNSLKEFNGDILFVSHDKGEVYRNCEEVCVIDNAKCDSCRYVNEVFATPKTYTEAVLVGIDNILKVDNSEYNYVGFRSVDVKINALKTSFSINGKIVDIKLDINKVIYYIQSEDFDKLIFVQSEKTACLHKIGENVSICVNSDDLYYLK